MFVFTRKLTPSKVSLITLIGMKSEAPEVTGTELEIVTPAATEILGPDVDRLATLYNNARTDRDLLAVWLKSHADGSPHTIRICSRVGERFLGALAAAGSNLRQATVEDVQAALEAMRSKADGSPVRPATVNTYVAAVKSFLGFAHRVGFTRFNAGPLIKLKKAPRQIAQRILSEVETAVLIRAAKSDRDWLMSDLAYFGGLRVSELVSLTWGQVIRRDSGEAQISIVGKGSKSREVLIPAVIATRLFASRGDAPASAAVFPSVRRPGSPLSERAVNFTSSGRPPSAPASIPPHGTRTLLTRSTMVPPSHSYRRRSGTLT